MATCLLSLGSNLGDREATLREALVGIGSLQETSLQRVSEWYRTEPVGGPPGQGEFLNAAAVIETAAEPLTLLNELQRIEAQHGRQRIERWAPRSLDIDLLLVDELVSETAELTLPHPRMSFRRFMLEPAAEIAGDMIHPTIGWTLERLRRHLDSAGDLAAILSPSERPRDELAAKLVERFDVRITPAPSIPQAARLWPPEQTTWVRLASAPSGGAQSPKLSILLDSGGPAQLAEANEDADWQRTAAQPGRGPTLRIATSDSATVCAEAFAAIESVWPHLGRAGEGRLQ